MIKVRTRYHKTTFSKLALAADEVLKIEGAVVIDVDFQSEDEIHELNARTRNVDRATDVLSYPYLENAKKAFTEKNYPSDYDPTVKAVALGCIAICREYIKKAAQEDSTVYISDVYRAFTHGILHLMGYDHVSVEQYDEMHGLEDEIMKKAGVIK